MVYEFNRKGETLFPPERFKVDNSTHKHFGVELEIECNSHNRNKISDQFDPLIKNFGFIKHDGSLDNGLEIVTLPLTLGQHDEFWTSVLDLAEKLELSSYDTDSCGMHVHFARGSVTDLQLLKILRFVNNHSNYVFLKKIAQRCDKQYANFRKMPEFDIDAVKMKAYPFNQKYLAVNIQPPTTFEFRLFKGTLNKRSLLKNVEFCAALIDFCSPSGTSMEDAKDWWKFMEFVTQNNVNYPLLTKFCLDKEINTLEAREGFKARRRAERGEEEIPRKKHRFNNGEAHEVVAAPVAPIVDDEEENQPEHEFPAIFTN